MAQLVSSREGLEAQLKVFSIRLEEKTSEYDKSAAKCIEQEAKIQEMATKLLEGESERRQLHNTVLELKVSLIFNILLLNI